MRRVVILGRGASGESTLARRLEDITGLPVTEMDKIFWRPGLIATPRGQWIKMQEQLVVAESNGLWRATSGPTTPSRSVFVRQIRSSFWISRYFGAFGEEFAGPPNALISGVGS
jgi:hypothetical protein